MTEKKLTDLICQADTVLGRIRIGKGHTAMVELTKSTTYDLLVPLIDTNVEPIIEIRNNGKTLIIG